MPVTMGGVVTLMVVNKGQRLVKCYCMICSGYIGEYRPYHARKTCSKECYSEYMSLINRGEGNGNFGHRWSEEARKQASIRAIKWHEDNKEEFLIANRNRKWTEEGLRNIGDARRSTKGIPRKCHSEESKRIIGVKSKAKWTPEYKQKFDDTMVERGHWLPKADREPYKVYRKLAGWQKRMWDFFPSSEKLKHLGVFSARSNSKGCVRDHMFSGSSGFRERVFPIILRHPANCQILMHRENVSKAQRGKKISVDGTLLYDDDISLEELFDKIEQFKHPWFEQDECLLAIERYRDGERFDIREVMRR